MVDIIPAVIPESFTDVEKRVRQVEGLVESFQIDVTDGEFVPSKSWPYVGGSTQELKEIETPLLFEIDLMVSEPEHVIDEWIAAGADRIIVHIESTEYVEACMRDSIEFGLAINIGTPNSALEPYLEHIDFIQFMGIRKIGYQRQEFDSAVVEKIRHFRKNFSGILQVDGGVNKESAPLLIHAGATRLVSGSALFGARNIEEAIEELSNS
ncbi:MAG: hypothetical protein WDZ90_02120 [Candidatus Paceibacterota bacterium]